MSQLDVGKLVADYIKLRDYKKSAEDEFKKSMERVNQAMDKLAGMALEHMTASGADSIATPAGTVYRNTQWTASVKDKAAFLDYVRNEGEWDALDVRANKTYVRETVSEGKDVPGVLLSSVHTVGVRRSS